MFLDMTLRRVVNGEPLSPHVTALGITVLPESYETSRYQFCYLSVLLFF